MNEITIAIHDDDLIVRTGSAVSVYEVPNVPVNVAAMVHWLEKKMPSGGGE